MSDLAILRLADAVARHAAGRHDLLARNVANADTPGYRALDLPPFEAALREAEAARATRPAHLNAAGRRLYAPQESAAFGAAAPNGNDVSLGDQMARASQAMDAHDRALTIYGKTLDILRAGLGRR